MKKYSADQSSSSEKGKSPRLKDREKNHEKEEFYSEIKKTAKKIKNDILNPFEDEDKDL